MLMRRKKKAEGLTVFKTEFLKYIICAGCQISFSFHEHVVLSLDIVDIFHNIYLKQKYVLSPVSKKTTTKNFDIRLNSATDSNFSCSCNMLNVSTHEPC